MELQQRNALEQNIATSIDTMNQLIKTNFDRFKQLEELQLAKKLKNGRCNPEKAYLDLAKQLQYV